jgi:hypothetical protein
MYRAFKQTPIPIVRTESFEERRLAAELMTYLRACIQYTDCFGDVVVTVRLQLGILSQPCHLILHDCTHFAANRKATIRYNGCPETPVHFKL